MQPLRIRTQFRRPMRTSQVVVKDDLHQVRIREGQEVSHTPLENQEYYDRLERVSQNMIEGLQRKKRICSIHNSDTLICEEG